MWTRQEEVELFHAWASVESDAHRDKALAVASKAVELYLARLAPTGQVAKDEYKIRNCILWADVPDDERSALLSASSRLAAGAQAREQAERERDEARKHGDALATALEGWRSRHALVEAQAVNDGNNFNERLQAMRAERDTARNERDEARREERAAMEGWDEAQKERDAARQEAESLRAQLDGARQNESRALEQGGRDQEEIDRLKAEVRQMVAQVAESTRLAEERLAERNATQAEAEALRAHLAERDAAVDESLRREDALRGRVAEVERERGKTLLLLGDWQQATRCSTPEAAASLLEQRAKALVRARNEGREEARKMVHNVGLHNLASLIEVSTEPES